MLECNHLVFSEQTKPGACHASKGNSSLFVPRQGPRGFSLGKHLLHQALKGDTANRDESPAMEGLRNFQRDHT